MVSLGIVLLRDVGALTGSTAGLAFLLHYTFDISFGLIFFLINLPFYFLAIRRMGWEFTIKTFITVALVSVLIDVHLNFIGFSKLQPFYAALLGNAIMGVGFIVLFRHQTSLGGINILSLHLQDHHGIRAGKVQMAVDVSVVLASLYVVSFPLLIASVFGAILLNLVIAINHRPNRYRA